jgi:hypothetical protein
MNLEQLRQASALVSELVGIRSMLNNMHNVNCCSVCVIAEASSLSPGRSEIVVRTVAVEKLLAEEEFWCVEELSKLGVKLEGR